MEINHQKSKKKKEFLKNEVSLRDRWDNFKHSNICIVGIPEGKEKEKGTEALFKETIDENFPNMGKETNTQVQEAQRVPNKINSKRPLTRQIIIKWKKLKRQS